LRSFAKLCEAFAGLAIIEHGPLLGQQDDRVWDVKPSEDRESVVEMPWQVGDLLCCSGSLSLCCCHKLVPSQWLCLFSWLTPKVQVAVPIPLALLAARALRFGMSTQYHKVDQQLLRDQNGVEMQPNVIEMQSGGNGHNNKPAKQTSFEPPLRTQTSLDITRVDTTEDDKVKFPGNPPNVSGLMR
jgi:hypothetical protein